jgi:hypothetical protein
MVGPGNGGVWPSSLPIRELVRRLCVLSSSLASKCMGRYGHLLLFLHRKYILFN